MFSVATCAPGLLVAKSVQQKGEAIARLIGKARVIDAAEVFLDLTLHHRVMFFLYLGIHFVRSVLCLITDTSLDGPGCSTLG